MFLDIYLTFGEIIFYGGVFMAVSHRSVISFGLVAIPVAMYTATQDNDIHFNQLHKEDKQRIRYGSNRSLYVR